MILSFSFIYINYPNSGATYVYLNVSYFAMPMTPDLAPALPVVLLNSVHPGLDHQHQRGPQRPIMEFSPVREIMVSLYLRIR